MRVIVATRSWSDSIQRERQCLRQCNVSDVMKEFPALYDTHNLLSRTQAHASFHYLEPRQSNPVTPTYFFSKSSNTVLSFQVVIFL